ncbi:TSUP family transporter [Pseudonocardia oceani]|uniref:TSUP family transporter n=1 Tax=Pseudonocardia oceani TaxID=2792013 RepID=UPI001C4A3BC7|nr:TSUP family transporter [Pseudonocardia oceani]
MLTTTDTVGGDCALPEGGVNWRGCLPRSIAAGLTVGFLTGLFGVGGGFLIIPAFVLLLGLPMGSAATTSLAVIVINSRAMLVGIAAPAAVLLLTPPTRREESTRSGDTH